MIVWRKHKSTTPPSWLDGLSDLHLNGEHCWRGKPGIFPKFSQAKWVTVSDGWEAALIGDFDPAMYLRTLTSVAPLAVIDGSGREWVIPAVLSPDGDPCVCQRWIMTDNGLERSPIHDRDGAAIDMCQWWRNAKEFTPQEMVSAIIAVVQCAYHLDALTIGKLGLIDDQLALRGINLASGKVPDDG